MRIMRLPLPVMVVAIMAIHNVGAQPPSGSQLAPEDNLCATCHGEEELWEGAQLRLYISRESVAEDVHLLAGVNCHDCHGGDPHSFDVPTAHSVEVDENDSDVIPFRVPMSEIRTSCAQCHKDQALGLANGVHANSGEKDEQGHRTTMECSDCHGEKAHGMVSVTDTRSPVFVDHQVRLCGKCHEKEWDAYLKSAHGHGLEYSGLLVTATCANCHGAHGIYPASDERSMLYATRVAVTCATCHRFIKERLERSVHGRDNGPGGTTEEAAPGGKVKRRPSCTDCHQRHQIRQTDSIAYRERLPNLCGNCHADLSSDYAISMHGELSELGYGPAADCSDCHGAHDILPVSDVNSKLSATNRFATCKQCHPRAARNFLDFDPHADHRDPDRDPVVHWVYVILMTFLISTFSFFGLHSVLWFLRGLIDVVKNGRSKRLVSGTTAYVRFGTPHRVAHVVMVISFLGLALTGLPLKYSRYQWAQNLAFALGGFQFTGVWHRFFGLVSIGLLVGYVVWILGRLFAGPGTVLSRIRRIFGPDSPVPTRRDVKDCGKMIRWFFGRGPKPTSDRWSYWEKYDFWGACADIAVIGFTGLVLWFPNLFCTFLPGKVLNIAKVIHSTQALLATGFVFAIHFFNTHLRPEKFPMDMSILTGLVSEEELREERPEYLERMRQNGKLDKLRREVPPRNTLALMIVGGSVALAIGLGLLAGILLPVLAN